MNTSSNATQATLPEIRAGSDGEAGGEPFPWGSLASRILHPVQVTVLEALVWIELPISPVDVTHMCDGNYALTLVGYHVKALAERGVIEPAATEQVRGVTRHLYALVPESRWP